MNIINSQMGSKVSQKEVEKFKLTEKHFFHGSHNSLTIIDKDIFLKYCLSLTKKQLEFVYIFFHALSNNNIIDYSEVKRTKKEEISYIFVTLRFKGKIIKKPMFYFFGLFKLLNLRDKAIISLSARVLIQIAQGK